jgi:hypothetical protein
VSKYILSVIGGMFTRPFGLCSSGLNNKGDMGNLPPCCVEKVALTKIESRFKSFKPFNRFAPFKTFKRPTR